MKPESQIRKLKKERAELRLICRAVGIPLLAIELPELILKGYKPSERTIKWSKK